MKSAAATSEDIKSVSATSKESVANLEDMKSVSAIPVRLSTVSKHKLV